MRQIMEFLLNLLLLRGKFLTTTAAETLHEAIRRCLKFKRKIHTEYNTRTQVITPFNDMMEFLNYNSSQYKCEQCDGKNFVIASQVHCDLYKYFNNTQTNRFQNSNSDDSPEQSDSSNRRAKEPSENQHSSAIPGWIRSEQTKLNKDKKKLHEDHIVDNLHAILKSQEYLFKNILKLVSVLEKQEIITGNTDRLQKLKQKSTACKDILSSTNPNSTQLFSNIINNIIEDEITRCRFRHGECKTSSEISLKIPKPQGIEIAAEALHTKKCLSQVKTQKTETAHPRKHSVEKSKSSQINEKRRNSDGIKSERKTDSLESPKDHKIDREVQTNASPEDGNLKQNCGLIPMKAPNRTKSDSNVESPLTVQNHKPIKNISTQTLAEVEDSRKLIEVNQGHFSRFEHKLWHSLTSLKCLSLKDEYLNMCKCSFTNKRHFATTELVIAKRMREEASREHFQKVIDISNAMFQNLEHRLLFERVNEEIRPIVTEVKILPKVESVRVEAKKKNPFLELIEQTPKNELEPVRNEVGAKTGSEVKSEGRKLNDSPGHKVAKRETEVTGAASSQMKKDKPPTTAAPQEIVTRKQDVVKPDVQKNSEKTFKNQDSNTVINGNVLQKLASSFSEGASRQKLISSQRGVSTDVKNDSPGKNVKDNDVKKKDKDELEFAEKHLTESQEKLKLHSTKTQVLEKGTDESRLSFIPNDPGVKKTISEPSVKRPTVTQNLSLTDIKPKEDISKIPDMPPQSGHPKKVPGSARSQDVKRTQAVQGKPNSQKHVNKTTQSSQSSVQRDQNDRKNFGESEKNSPNLIPENSHQSHNKVEDEAVENLTKYKENIPQVPLNDWKKMLGHISAKETQIEGALRKSEEAIVGTKDTDKEIVMTKETLEMQEKRAISEILDKHTRIASSSVIEDGSFEAKIKEVVTRTQSLEEKVACLFSSKQTIVTEEKSPNLQSQKSKRTGSVSKQEMRNEAKRIKVNEKAYKDLESTIRTVPVLNDTKDAKRSPRGTKTTVESRRRKMDEPAKKNMSTRHHGCTAKQHFFTHKIAQPQAKTSAGISDNAKDRLHLYKEVKKQTTRYSVPHDKTFLKSTTWQKCKLRSGQMNENQKWVHSLAQPAEVEESKSKPQMRRTTKNAMKRQQVITISPKNSKKSDEKEKSEASLVATKGARLKEENVQEDCSVSKHPIKICRVDKVVGTRKTFSASLLKEVVHKTLSGNFRRIKWEDKNDEIASIFKC